MTELDFNAPVLGAVHDFRNMLMVLQGNMTLLQMYLADMTGYERHKLLALTERSLAALLLAKGLCDEILCSVTSPQSATDNSQCHLGLVVRNTLDTMLSLIIPTSTVTTRIEEDPLVAVSSLNIQRTTLNLLNNAIYALKSPDSSNPQIVIRVTTCQGTAFAPSQNSGSIMLDYRSGFSSILGIIEVEDNGPGITTDVLPDIFTPCYTTKRNGTGLGLSVIQQIVMAAKGCIYVRSQEDYGTLFKIGYPLIPSPNES